MTHWRVPIREFRPNWHLIGVLAALAICWGLALWGATSAYHWTERHW